MKTFLLSNIIALVILSSPALAGDKYEVNSGFGSFFTNQEPAGFVIPEPEPQLSGFTKFLSEIVPAAGQELEEKIKQKPASETILLIDFDKIRNQD